MKIIVENSTWNNIGDGWYQSSLYALIKKLYPNDDVFMGEGPIARSFKIQKNKRYLENSFKMMDHQKGDLHIFSGPMMKDITGGYKSKIIEIKNRGAEYAFISGSGTAIPPSKLKEIGEFLTKYPCLFFSSRDEETFNNFSPFIKNSYNGICTAFIVERVLELDKIEMDKPFFISSFYRELEPVFNKIDESKPITLENISAKRKKTFFNLKHSYSRHFNYLRPQQESLGNHHIVRLIQDLNTRFNHINFSHPNSFISFNPISYLSLVNSAEFVISDRVHACAIALACNKPAQFLYETPRAGIFTRLGFDHKANNGIIQPNMEIIDEELEKLKKEILKAI